MNILFYTNESPYGSLPVGGAETSLKLLAECLAARGHNIYFYTDSRESAVFGYTQKRKNGVMVYTNKRFVVPLLNTYAIKRFTKKIKNKKLRDLLRGKKIDLVHTYYTIEACTKFLGLREQLPFKFVVRIAGMRPFEQVKRRPVFLEAYQRLFKEADLYNFISEGLYHMYLQREHELGFEVDKDKIFIKDIGVRLNGEKMWSLQHDAAEFRCTMVSRFTKYAKRQDILVKAISLLPKEVPVQLTLVGSGPNVTEIKKLIKSLGLELKVSIVKFLPQQQMKDLLLQSNLICHACDHEGLSKIIIESMGMGVPVLASDVAPLNTYIRDGENGFLTENTPEAWAEKIAAIYNEKSILDTISDEAAAFVKNNYDAKENVKIYEQEFNTLLNSKSKN